MSSPSSDVSPREQPLTFSYYWVHGKESDRGSTEHLTVRCLIQAEKSFHEQRRTHTGVYSPFARLFQRICCVYISVSGIQATSLSLASLQSVSQVTLYQACLVSGPGLVPDRESYDVGLKFINFSRIILPSGVRHLVEEPPGLQEMVESESSLELFARQGQSELHWRHTNFLLSS